MAPAKPPSRPSAFRFAEAFLDMMAAERGASRNTLDAYRADLADYHAFLVGRGVGPLEAQTDLVRQLQARSVRRIYLALVHGRVEREGEVDMPIGRDPRDRTRMATLHGGKPALSRYRVRHHDEDATLLECRLETGRTHQIRVHMHALHHALVGDPVYRGRHAGSAAGAARELSTFPRQALHATQLSFVHPRSRQTVSFEAAVPQDMQDLPDAVQ
jgi:23S rRNA pseudouridine1911/1915/1917 synthase